MLLLVVCVCIPRSCGSRSATPDVLSPFVASYRRLAEAYGEAVVLEWLRKAPPIIRTEDEVRGHSLTVNGIVTPVAIHEGHQAGHSLLSKERLCQRSMLGSASTQTHRAALSAHRAALSAYRTALSAHRATLLAHRAAFLAHRCPS